MLNNMLTSLKSVIVRSRYLNIPTAEPEVGLLMALHPRAVVHAPAGKVMPPQLLMVPWSAIARALLHDHTKQNKPVFEDHSEEGSLQQ